MPPREQNHLKEIIITLADNEVEFIICGGVALVLHGVERMTMDIDLAVDMQSENLKKFLSAMDILGLVPRAPIPADSLIDPEKRRIMVEDKNALVFTFIDTENPYRQVDIFLDEKLSYDTLSKDVDLIDIDNHRIKAISKERLLEMKRAVSPLREKDIFDIHELEKIIKNGS